jgi:hypothetical protein
MKGKTEANSDAQPKIKNLFSDFRLRTSDIGLPTTTSSTHHSYFSLHLRFY